MEKTVEFRVTIDQYKNVVITAGYDMMIFSEFVPKRLHFPIVVFSNWEDFVAFVDMLNKFREKHSAQVPKAFTNAFNGEK